jgi:AraC-like DNA-binding protein
MGEVAQLRYHFGLMAQPQFELIPSTEDRAFVYKIDRDIWPVYHYHPEFDILLSLKDHAGQFISGDHIGRLERGTLFMNGSNIPHGLHSGRPDEKDWDRPSLAVIQFSRKTLGPDFLAKSEFAIVRQFLDDARHGFEFHGETREIAWNLMLEMREKNDLERFVDFLRLLQLFAESDEKTPLASPAYSPSLREQDISRIDRVIQFLRERKTEPVRLEETAAVAKLTPKSFCRFFKANTGRTLVQYLNELRIGEACRLLLESDRPITEIALASGFNNLSNFNRRFRQVKGIPPREFRTRFTIDIHLQGQPLPASM